MNYFNKKYLKDKYIFLFLGAAIIAVGTFGFRDRLYQSEQNENEIFDFEELMPLQCERGEWIIFPDMKEISDYEKFIGKEKITYDEKQGVFLGKDGKTIYGTDERYSLFFFIDRDIEVDGYKLSNGEIYARRVRCVGAEANRDVLQTRRKLMEYVDTHINDLALEKTRNGDWQVHAFYFVNDTDLYVQYETESSFMEEAPYDSHLWLIRVGGWSGDIPVIETIAYIQEDVTDFEKNIVKKGQDIYKDVQNMTIYEFDDGLGQWVLQ